MRRKVGIMYRLGATVRIRRLQGLQKERRRPACLRGLPWERISLCASHTGVDADKGGVCLLQFLFVGVVRVYNGVVVGNGVTDKAVGFPPEVRLVLPGDYF